MFQEAVKITHSVSSEMYKDAKKTSSTVFKNFEIF